jgi:Fe-S cluster assembly iron-binding protein IscA
MVTLTESAAEGIKALLAAINPPPEVGLRITYPGTNGADYDLALAAAPIPGDAVTHQRGVRLFLAADARDGLDGKRLDARVQRGVLRVGVEG